MPIGMPRLGQYNKILDVVFFLYHTVEDARAGTNFGGTGFLVSLPTPWPDRFHVYAVTNWHVAIQSGASMIRLNTIDGNTDVFEFGPEDWHFIPDYHDIAVIPLPIKERHKVKFLEDGYLASKQFLTESEVGPGDDVMMIGRFSDYDGIQTNQPAVRFGHISMIDAPIKQSNGYQGGSFILDMHSRAGFSGSPVFAYRTLGSEFHDIPKGKIITGNHMMTLLGIHWGQFPELWELQEKKSGIARDEASMIVDGAYVKGFSGMTCVSPAYAIRKVLDSPNLEEIRSMKEAKMEKIFGSPMAVPLAEVSEGHPTTESNLNHREDFNQLLDAAVSDSKEDHEK